jgi:hypothetical protein
MNVAPEADRRQAICRATTLGASLTPADKVSIVSTEIRVSD